MNKLSYKLLLVSLLIALTSCYTDVEEKVQRTNKIFENGKRIEVKKLSKITKHIGVFSKNQYGVNRKFSYHFTVDSYKGKVDWKDKGNSEPKHLVFCKDSLYVKFLRKIQIKTVKKVTDSTSVTRYNDTVKELFEVHIDNRYFFRLFGDNYWVTIPAEKYNDKKITCTEYDIPNDNELILETELIIIKDVKEKLVKAK